MFIKILRLLSYYILSSFENMYYLFLAIDHSSVHVFDWCEELLKPVLNHKLHVFRVLFCGNVSSKWIDNGKMWALELNISVSNPNASVLIPFCVRLLCICVSRIAHLFCISRFGKIGSLPFHFERITCYSRFFSCFYHIWFTLLILETMYLSSGFSHELFRNVVPDRWHCKNPADISVTYFGKL